MSLAACILQRLQKAEVNMNVMGKHWIDGSSGSNTALPVSTGSHSSLNDGEFVAKVVLKIIWGESSRGVFTPPNGFLLLLFELFLVLLGWVTVSPR